MNEEFIALHKLIIDTQFKIGYEKAKKELELTWKDLQKLDIIANKLWQDGKYDKNDAQEFYTEVLKRFKEYKVRQNK